MDIKEKFASFKKMSRADQDKEIARIRERNELREREEFFEECDEAGIDGMEPF